MTSSVDVLVLFHNSRPDIPAFISGLRNARIPITAYFLDNASADGTPEALEAQAPSLPFRTYVLRSLRNNGFARGMNLLAALGRAEFMFLLNPDTELQPGCLELLLERASRDDSIAMCEARQIPREHPKAFDPVTGETTWCSGAAVLIRRSAFHEAGGFNERLYFMYCEDVDLSWQLWLKGWKCVYVREAAVKHFTQDLAPGKRRTLENYFSFRNSLFLYYRFGTRNDRRLLLRFFRKRFFSRAYSVRSKVLFAIALIEHIRYIPYLLRGRDNRVDPSHPWIRLKETSLSH